MKKVSWQYSFAHAYSTEVPSVYDKLLQQQYSYISELCTYKPYTDFYTLKPYTDSGPYTGFYNVPDSDNTGGT